MARHGPAQAAIAEYLQAASEFSGCSAESAYLKLHEVRLSQDDMANTKYRGVQQRGGIHLRVEAKQKLDHLAIVVHLRDANEVHVASMCSPEEGHSPFSLSRARA